MILTYHSGACIRASAGDTTLVFGPVSKSSKNFKPTNFGADIALVPLNHRDMNGSDEAGRGDKVPFVIHGPGEYEVKGVGVAGFPTKSSYGSRESINTVYAVSFDGMSVLYLGGEGALKPDDAHELAVKLEAKIVIPVLFDDRSLKLFLKEAGAEGTKPVDKLTIKPKDIANKENEAVVLSV